ncbi:PhzF family phenazine biosynthesis protein [Comamonadaceae bacterium G21597-S1]|nr:PhzF family phenazine biosynthesis protein [Comamonadaceae bacterium G21597-S1]
MTPRPFQQVDVFTATPYRGNPLAVVLQADGLDDATMQGFARWTNLSETTFLLAPTDAGADYRVRIFTPGGELQFAGHPTLGSCHAWLAAGGKPQARDQVVQQCGVGLVTIRRDAERLAFGAPKLRRNAVRAPLLASVAAALGLRPAQVVSAQLLDNGTAWMGLLLDDASTVAQLKPDFGRLAATGNKVGVAAARADGGDVQLEVRAFAPHLGVNEDPVTGSLNASLAQWLIADGHMPGRYVAAQGAALGRAGRVHIDSDATGQVWVGGSSATCIQGSVRL